MNSVATEADNNPLNVFRKNIQDKIAADIGGLMPEEMLKKLVEDSVKSILYEPTRKASTSSYGTPETVPFIKQEVDKFIGDQVRAMVITELEAKKAKIFEVVKKQVEEKFPLLVTTLITQMFMSNTQLVTHTMMNEVVNMLRTNNNGRIF